MISLFACVTFFFFFFFFAAKLDESKDFEERKMIRAAMRDLRKRKRGNSRGSRVTLTMRNRCASRVFLTFM